MYGIFPYSSNSGRSSIISNTVSPSATVYPSTAPAATLSTTPTSLLVSSPTEELAVLSPKECTLPSNTIQLMTDEPQKRINPNDDIVQLEDNFEDVATGKINYSIECCLPASIKVNTCVNRTAKV